MKLFQVIFYRPILLASRLGEKGKELRAADVQVTIRLATNDKICNHSVTNPIVRFCPDRFLRNTNLEDLKNVTIPIFDTYQIIAIPMTRE